MSDKHPIRRFRVSQKPPVSLERLADLLAAEGVERPSAAKLSRIETGQPCPTELLRPLEKITGVPAKEIRPDLAEIFVSGGEAAQ